jgi:DNA-binding response OmpR family regulator
MYHSTHILVVDDDPLIRSLLRHGLEDEGYAISEAADRTTLTRCLEAEKIDLVTLDLGLPSGDGLGLAREIRMKRNIPIIMITGRDTREDRQTGLEHGADDYVVKPFRIREVALRVRNVLARYQHLPLAVPALGVDEECYVFDGGRLDVGKRELKDNSGGAIAAPEIELQLLVMFLRHPQRVLSRDEIARVLYDRDWSPHDRDLDVHITRLRKKIQPVDTEARLIRSVRNVGYVFTGEVKRI